MHHIFSQDDGGEHNTTTGFGATQQEISVVLDLLDNNIWLFEVKKKKDNSSHWGYLIWSYIGEIK